MWAWFDQSWLAQAWPVVQVLFVIMQDLNRCMILSEKNKLYIEIEWKHNYGNPIWNNPNHCGHVYMQVLRAFKENSHLEWWITTSELSFGFFAIIGFCMKAQWLRFFCVFPQISVPANTCVAALVYSWRIVFFSPPACFKFIGLCINHWHPC